MNLSPAETAFVEALIETGNPAAAASIAGTQPSLARDPRIQSALVEQLRSYGAVDAVYARKVLYDLAKSADQDGTRLRAAMTLWERGLGKIPEQVNVDVAVKGVTREALYAEIRLLIDEIGLPPAVEGEFTEVEPLGETPSEQIDPPEAGVAQEAEQPAPAREDAASKAAAGTYTPELPPKWR